MIYMLYLNINMIFIDMLNKFILNLLNQLSILLNNIILYYINLFLFNLCP